MKNLTRDYNLIKFCSSNFVLLKKNCLLGVKERLKFGGNQIIQNLPFSVKIKEISPCDKKNRSGGFSEFSYER